MWGDYQVDNPNTLTDKQRETLINQSKLIAGVTAAFADADVTVAANVAGEAVRWNSAFGQGDGVLGLGIDDEFRQIMNNNGQNIDFLSLHAKYNDMTIFNVTGGVFSYSLVVNNKNEKVYRPEMFEVSTSSSLASLAASINFGSIIGGEKSADDIDRIILGASVGWQSCYGVCAGVIRTQGKDTIITYGVGTPQFGVSGGKMVYTGVTLSQAEIKKLVK